MEENQRLQLFNDQLHRQASELMDPALLELCEKITRLRETHQRLAQEQSLWNQTRTTHQHADEQLQTKNNRTATRINHLLQRMKNHDQDVRQNTEYIETLGKNSLIFE